MLCVSFLLANSMATLLAIMKGFPFFTLNSGKYQVGKNSTDCISEIVPLKVATHRVTMDTTLCSDYHMLLMS